MGLCLGTHSASPNPPITTQNETRQSDEREVVKEYRFAEMKAATKNFRNRLGEGSSGTVYTGWVDRTTLAPAKPDTGMMVAIKWHTDSSQGFEDWQSKMSFLSKLSHQNVVKLLGYCREKDELLLVYEFMPEGSLHDRLFKRNENVKSLPWDRRLQIAIDVGQGLAFLHNSDNNVIHRDIKPSIILLDENYNAKLSNFNMARSGPSDDNLDVSTRVMGTCGYIAPEYMATGRLSIKADVYGFGAVLLEMLTGLKMMDARRAEQQDLVDWVRQLMQLENMVSKIMDVEMDGQYSPKAALQAVQIAMKCLDIQPTERPSMRDIVEELEGIRSNEKLKESINTAE